MDGVYNVIMSIFSSTAIRALVVSASMTLLLSGCGSSKPVAKPEDSLIKSCEQLNLNLNALRQKPDLYKVDDPSEKLTTDDEYYFVEKIGKKTRKRNKDVFLSEYGFMAKELKTYVDFLGKIDNVVTYKFFAEAIKNTGFEMNLTQSQISSLKGDFEDPSYDPLEAEIRRIIGVDFEDGHFVENTGCKLVSGYKYDLNQEDPEKYPLDDELDDTDFLWGTARNNVEWVYEVVGYTNICQKEGTYLGHKCARNDYVSEGDDSLPAPSPVDPWSRTWSSQQQEELAKTVWCINNGYRNYIYSKDICTNTISR